MYEIKAYVREVMAEHVVDALARVKGVTSIAVVPLSEFGHLVGDESPLIVRTGRTQDGHPGDGKVLVSRLVRAVRIEDGETGESALEPASS